mmetsp:Transcript_2243/g.6412  ORF Transcript_2243/g.6412 Transcript_2243/m.6412 type:complete len:93 (+) Transcript_2243:848-1126(+)
MTHRRPLDGLDFGTFSSEFDRQVAHGILSPSHSGIALRSVPDQDAENCEGYTAKSRDPTQQTGTLTRCAYAPCPAMEMPLEWLGTGAESRIS